MPIIQACYCCCTSVRQLAYAAGIYSMLAAFCGVFAYLVLEAGQFENMVDEKSSRLDQNKTPPEKDVIAGNEGYKEASVISANFTKSNYDTHSNRDEYEKEPFSYMGFNKEDVYWQKQISFICDLMVLGGCIPLFYGLTTHKKYWLLPWIVSKTCQSLIELVTAISLLCLENAKFEPVTAFMFTGYFFLFFLNVYAVLAVISQFQEIASRPLIIEYELGQVSNKKADQTQLCITSSGEGKGTTNVIKKDASYLEWSCNEPENQESNNSASTATSGTIKSSNGNTTKVEEVRKNSNSYKLSFGSKSKIKNKKRNTNEKDVDGTASVKLLPKLVVTHVTDLESSNELEGHKTKVDDRDEEETERFSNQSRNGKGPRISTSSGIGVIENTKGTTTKNGIIPENSQKTKKYGFKSLHHVRTSSIPKSKNSKHIKDALKKHSNRKRKLDAIEEASVELMSSTAAVSYTFAAQSDDEEDNNCDGDVSNKHSEMHTIDEVNGVIHDVPGNGSSTTNSGNETTTSNTSDESNDPFETISHPTRSASFPASSTNSMKPFIASIDEQNRKTSSCGKLPSNYCYDCESTINVNNTSQNGNQLPSSTLKSPIINDLKPFHRNEVDI